jgi:alkylmercury lyase
MAREIRPGIHRPDWSVVTRPPAREALLDRERSRVGLAEKWNQTLEPAQDRMWRAVLELFARSGRPPHLYEIGEQTGLPAENLRMLVADLQAHDLLGCDHSADVILYAYPFTSQHTEYRVQLFGRRLRHRCTRRCRDVSDRCRYWVFLPRLRSRHQSRHRRKWEVFEPRATCGCRCVGASRLQWVRRGILLSVNRVPLLQTRTAAMAVRAKPLPRGYWLTFDEALEVGRALFEPVLAAPRLTP